MSATLFQLLLFLTPTFAFYYFWFLIILGNYARKFDADNETIAAFCKRFKFLTYLYSDLFDKIRYVKRNGSKFTLLSRLTINVIAGFILIWGFMALASAMNAVSDQKSSTFTVNFIHAFVTFGGLIVMHWIARHLKTR